MGSKGASKSQFSPCGRLVGWKHHESTRPVRKPAQRLDERSPAAGHGTAGPGRIRVELFAGIGQLPLFNPELEATMPAPVRALHARIDSSDALLIASPEYAHGVTGTLKNALDWLVSHEGFVDKRVAIFNASPRSVHADAQLREILTTMSATLVADACLALPLRGTGITEQGILESGHAADIRRALTLLVSGAPRA
jgi:NAD(P)H-dependent FMN reductase